jgi:hypothetical protein
MMAATAKAAKLDQRTMRAANDCPYNRLVVHGESRLLENAVHETAIPGNVTTCQTTVNLHLVAI